MTTTGLGVAVINCCTIWWNTYPTHAFNHFRWSNFMPWLPYWRWKRFPCFPKLKWQSTWQTEVKWRIACKPLLYFPFSCSFSRDIAVFLFPSPFCLSFSPISGLPSPFLLPLTLLCFCLTAVELLWEVIRKNSTETHTAAAENKAFSIFYSPSMHYNSKRLGVRGRGEWGKLCMYYRDIFREWCWEQSVALVSPKLYALRYLMQACTWFWHSEAKGLAWSCLANWQPRL